MALLPSEPQVFNLKNMSNMSAIPHSKPLFSLDLASNRAEFIGHFNISQLRSALGGLRVLIDERKHETVVLDFSQCNFTHAPPMLAVATAVEHYRARRITFDLILPSDDKVARLFRNSNWAHVIAPNNFPPSDYKSRIHMPAMRYRSADEQHHLVNELLNTMLSSITEFERSHFKAIEWSINELTDNVLVHSESSQGGIVQLTAMKTSKKVEFVVCDSGIGIPKSLGSSGLKISSDVDALSKAIEQGITRDKSVGQGNGLYGSYQIAVKSGGNFSVHSGRATLYYAPKAGMHTKREHVSMPGTVVVCGIDYSHPLLLEEALNIGGSRHSPIDMIETKYESTDDGNILFSLKDESDSFGSRTAGTPVRNKLKNLYGFLAGNKLIIDLSDIHLVSSSFADEVFGKLFVELGPVNFSSKIELKDVDHIVRLLIDKAIMQRMADRK